MQLTAPAQSTTWTYVDGDWHEGNVGILGPRSLAVWQSSSVFDGARWFEGVSPDLDRHAERINASATALALCPTTSTEEIVGLTRDGLKKFSPGTAVYIRPMYWAEHGGALGVVPDPDSTRFCLSLIEAPMSPPTPFSLGVASIRRPGPAMAPTDAKGGFLYPNNARAIREVNARGFDNALVLDMLGNVAETATSNIFMVKDGVVNTPAANRSFLSGVTRRRVIALLADEGIATVEKTLTLDDFYAAEEVFCTANYTKVMPVSRIEGREFQWGTVTKRARELYWEWAHSTQGQLALRAVG